MCGACAHVLHSLVGSTGAQGVQVYDVHNTHTLRYLDGSAPDITITRRGRDPTSFSSIMVFELQVRPGTMLGTEPLLGIAIHDCSAFAKGLGGGRWLVYAFLPQFVSHFLNSLPTYIRTLTRTHAQRGELDNGHRGQSMRYCELMLHANPGRHRAMCVLTNCESMEVYCAHRSQGGIRYTRSSPVQLSTGASCCTQGWHGLQE